MATKKTKGKKSTRAKPAKRRKEDYGKPVETKAPSGFKRSTAGDRHFTFDEIGQRIAGTFERLEEVQGRGKSNILHYVDQEGNPRTAFSSSQIEKHLEQNDIQPGTEFELVFSDVIEISGGKLYKVYDFYFKPPKSSRTKKGKK